MRPCRLGRWGFLLSGALGLLSGCQWFVDDADREVYRLLDKRQPQAIGESREVRIDREIVPGPIDSSAYEFVPHPVDSEVPERFRLSGQRPPAHEAAEAARHESATQPADEPPSPGEPDLPDRRRDGSPSPIDAPATGTAPAPARAASQPAAPRIDFDADARVFTLADALAYAFAHSREFQSAKEDLYLAALALTLERHLWTPRPFGELHSQYANYGQANHFDHAMDAVAEAGVRQRLPYGGEVTARVINNWMRDLTNRATVGESGAMLLEANVPLLRGAGRAAFESRYQAERNLIYAVRTLESFRRGLAVDIASDYFELQQLRQEIINAEESIDGFSQLANRARAFWDAGRLIILDVQRAEQDRLVAMNRQVTAIERYQTALDSFKLRIGMPTSEPVTVELTFDVAVSTRPAGEEPPEDPLLAELAMPEIDEQEATRQALKYRLDLLNELDRFEDSRRGVKVAENNLLPDLAAWGSVRLDTEPGRLGFIQYNTERTTWRGGIDLELPLDRKAERNVFREALITQRRSARGYEEARDTVQLQVRRAMRRVEQQQESLRIQIDNRNLAVKRLQSARWRFDRGRLGNRDVVEAQNALLSAQNQLASAQAGVRTAILEFWRDTGTLRVDDSGRWQLPAGPPPQANG